MEQLGIDTDVVFYGDSLTSAGNFQDAFQNVDIVNLGLSGDSLNGMIERVDMIQMVTPEKIFVLGGINSLRSNNFEETLETYTLLIETIIEDNPDAEVYLQSILPVTEEREENSVANEIIVEFNEEIEKLADEMGLTYINLYDLYVEDGYMNSELTTDGVHLEDGAYQLWYDAIRQYVYD